MARTALGRLYNVAVGGVPVDSAAITGLRIHLKDYSSVTFVYISDAGTAGEDTDLDVQEHNASSSGTSQDLDVVTKWYKQREATLDGDEGWTKVTQTAASEVDLGDDEGETQNLAVVEVRSEQLSDGFEWVSCNATDPGATAGKLSAIVAILNDPAVQRAPENLAVVLT